MSDLIDRQAAIDALEASINTINERMQECLENEMFVTRAAYKNCKTQALDDIETIKTIPSAQPEIIRCKDCKHWIPYDWMFSEVWISRNMADYPESEMGCDCCDMAMKANDFCSRSERREVTE